MTPQDLVTALLEMNEEQGKQLLQSYIPHFSAAGLDRLVFALKKAADRSWRSQAERSLLFSGYLLLIGEQTGNVLYQAIGLMTRGDALRRMHQYQEALPFFDAAGEAFLSVGDEVGWARTRFGRISACLALNRTTEALRDAEHAHEIFVRYGNLRRAGQIDVNAAIINFELGHYEQALRLFDRAIETYTQYGDGVELYIARAQANKALVLAAQGKFREAVTLHEQARATFALCDGNEEMAMAREDLNIADIYAAQGHYSQAFLLYNRSRTLFHKHQVSVAAYEVALQMCQCLLHLNRAQEAYELATETNEFFQLASDQRHNLARALMHKASAAILLDDNDAAGELLREASSLLEEGGFTRLAAMARLQRAELYFSMRDLDASAREAEYVADAFAEQEDLPRLAQAMLLQGRIAEARGEIEIAQDLCLQALDVARNQNILDLEYHCYDALGQLVERRGDLAAASTYYDLAIERIDELQSRLVLDARTSFLENKAALYQRAILLALRRERVEQAFTYVEKAKSRALGDYLHHNIDIRIRFDGNRVDDDLLNALRKAREEQAYFSSIVYQTEHEVHLSDSSKMRVFSVSPDRARQEMQKRERIIEQLLEQIQLYAAADLRYRPRSGWTRSMATSLYSTLEPTTLMVEYYLTDQDLYIFQTTQQGVTVQHYPGVFSMLERLLSLWRTNLDLAGRAAQGENQQHTFTGLLENSLGLLQRLYTILLRPLEDMLSACEHLIIVPYGILHYLPFHCLYDGTHFAIERVQISYLPAASLLSICRQRGERVQSRPDKLNTALVMGLADSGRLQYAVHEAEIVARRLGVACILNKDATSTVLSRNSPLCSLVHIAAHGLFRLDAPNFSYIQLADRQLSTIEAFNLDLSSCSLVVLSACETGRTVIGGVDEVIGLGRGFLYAGAASILPTLWKVDDASSAELMEIFYQSLLNGADKSAALAYAQRVFIARARDSLQTYRLHPYFWAAFQLIGDAGPLF